MGCPICPGCEGAYPGPPRLGIGSQREEPAVKADKRYYLTADRSRVVDEADPEAAVLLAAEGDDISDEDARRLGLVGKKPAAPEPVVVHSIAADPEPKADDPAETKAVERAPANKARSARDAEDK